MRIVRVLLVLFAAALPATHAAGRYVNLNKPGAMEKLERQNPKHYRAVSDILQAALRQAEPAGNPALQQAALTEWYRVQSTYGAKDVYYAPILLTTDPPKRELSFRLDDVLYRKLLTLSPVQAIAEPAGAVAPRTER